MRAYCVGTAQSGTHSLAAVFARSYAAEHEPQHRQMMQAVTERIAGMMSDSQAEQFILDRDRELSLEIDCSQFNGPFVDVMAKVFADAKFILTLRDCFSFVDSVINHTLARESSQCWLDFRVQRFGELVHAPQERILAEHGLFTLGGYLSYWARHNQFVLDNVPSERLLVVRSTEINESIPTIAEFLGIEADSLDAAEAHSYPASKCFGILSQIDPQFVQQKAEEHCGQLMRRFYPELMKNYGHLARGNFMDAKVA